MDSRRRCRAATTGPKEHALTDAETKATVPGRRPELEPVSVRSRLLAHLQTWRLYTLFYVGLVGLAGALLADPSGPAWRLAPAWRWPPPGWSGGHYGGGHLRSRSGRRRA